MAVPIRILARKAQAGDQKASLEAAGRKDADATLLEFLSHSDFIETRIAVAGNPASSEETLLRIAYDPDIQVSAALARRAHLTPEILKSLALRASAEYYIRRGRERALVLEIVVALASNDEIPIKIITDLMQKITTSLLPRILAREATRTEVLAILFEHPKPTVRQELIANPSLPEEFLLELRSDTNEKVAAAAEKEWQQNHKDSIAQLEQDYHNLKLEQGNTSAGSYESDALLLAGTPEILQEKLSFFTSHLPAQGEQGLSIFELGCASGRLTAALAEANPVGSTVGIEISPELLNLAGKNCAGLSGVEFIQHDLSSGLPRENAAVDVITAWEVFHCVPDAEALLRSCKRALRDGGIFLGIFGCLADDSHDNEIFASIAGAYGFFFQTFDLVSMQLATSGLAISELSATFEESPRATDLTILESLHNPLWLEIMREAEAAGCNPVGVRRGIVRVVAKKVQI